MSKLDTLNQIESYNAGRIPELLQMKYTSMRQDVFRFYRGTAHLFYHFLPKYDVVYDAPNAWICGDLHFENFGSFKGDNGLVYFDINDFDEALLAPCLFDVARFLVSLRLIAELSNLSLEDTEKLCEYFLTVYCETLLTGASRSVEMQTSKGIVKHLFKKVNDRKPLANLYSEKNGETRSLDFEHAKLVKPSEENKAIIYQLIVEWNKLHKAKSLYDVIDIGYHLKGTGSLGLERYILMVQKISNQKFKLIDLKTATPSCALSAVRLKQPKWKSEAERIIEIQKRVQGTSQALLKSIELNDKSYVLREYQSFEDKINYKLINGDKKSFKTVVSTMAQVTAWGQLQSGGRQGSCITDDLIAFALKKDTWQKGLLQFTKTAVKTVQKDYQIFSTAYDKGELNRINESLKV